VIDRALTVDVAVLTDASVLLVQRANDPFAGRWALPGGFIDPGERALAAAVRELAEETGLHAGADRLELFGVYDAPGRDPRGPSMSIAFLMRVPAELAAQGADDAADARWWPLDGLPALAFDHAQLVADAAAHAARP
jgi:8-oxo-dGTP diphosphatase